MRPYVRILFYNHDDEEYLDPRLEGVLGHAYDSQTLETTPYSYNFHLLDDHPNKDLNHVLIGICLYCILGDDNVS